MDHVWELAELIQERNMIYVKSVLAGVAALLVASVVPVTWRCYHRVALFLWVPKISAEPTCLLTQTQIY